MQSLEMKSDDQGSMVVFKDVRINSPGRYRVGVSLFRVAEERRGGGGGVVVGEVKSGVVEVREGTGEKL